MECKGLKEGGGDPSKDPLKSKTPARLSLLDSAELHCSTRAEETQRSVPLDGSSWGPQDPLAVPGWGPPAERGSGRRAHTATPQSQSQSPVTASMRHRARKGIQRGKRHHEEEEEEEDEKHRVITPDKEEPDPGFSEWVGTVSAKDTTLFVSFLLCTVFQVRWSQGPSNVHSPYINSTRSSTGALRSTDPLLASCP